MNRQFSLSQASLIDDQRVVGSGTSCDGSGTYQSGSQGFRFDLNTTVPNSGYVWIMPSNHERIAMFDEKEPYLLLCAGSPVTIGWSAPLIVGWYESGKRAREEAEIRITADKTKRFVILKAQFVIEPEPVKTRVRELK